MHVLVLPAWYNPSNINEGIFIHEFCEALERNGVKVTLLHLQVLSIRQLLLYLKPVQVKFHQSYAVETVRYLKLTTNSNAKQVLSNKVIKRFRKKQFDAVHTQSVCNNVTSFIAHHLAENKKIKHIITEHYTSFKEASGKLFLPFLNKQVVTDIVEKANNRVAVSQYAATIFESYFGASYSVIPNIISLPYFSKPFVNPPHKERFVFAFIGALEERKGILELLEVVNQLQHLNVYLHVIGNGSLYQTIQAFILANQLSGRITIHGSKSVNEIIDVLDASHALISASNMETFGLVIAEAHLRGRPVIATNVGAVGELIDETNGMLIDNSNKVIELKAAIVKFTETSNYFNYSNIRDKAVLRYNEKAVIDIYKNLYLS
jgi:glycosyltransferase involved in cell wall biosynthesis